MLSPVSILQWQFCLKRIYWHCHKTTKHFLTVICFYLSTKFYFCFQVQYYIHKTFNNKCRNKTGDSQRLMFEKLWKKYWPSEIVIRIDSYTNTMPCQLLKYCQHTNHAVIVLQMWFLKMAQKLTRNMRLISTIITWLQIWWVIRTNRDVIVLSLLIRYQNGSLKERYVY